MSWSYGASPVPYGLNRSIAAATGRTFVDLHAGWRAYRMARYGLQGEVVPISIMVVAVSSRHSQRRKRSASSFCSGST